MGRPNLATSTRWIRRNARGVGRTALEATLPAVRHDAIWDRAVRHALLDPQRGTRTYRRVVLLANPRSGSNLVSSTLNEHPRALMRGEPFDPQRVYIKAKSIRLATHLRDADPARFLDDFVFTEAPEDIALVGFTLFGPQYRHPPFHSVLEQIVFDPDVAIIRLRRQNKLAAYLSFVRAIESEQWAQFSPGSGEPPPTHLDASACERHFRQSLEDDAVNESICTQREGAGCLELTYEDLVSDFETTLAAVQRFLGLDGRALSPILVKQRTTPLSASIENFDELQSYFRDTPWAEFFEHDDFDQAVS